MLQRHPRRQEIQDVQIDRHMVVVDPFRSGRKGVAESV